jgi:beta-lactamase regulating signal transducer with metallopeptidase domain
MIAPGFQVAALQILNFQAPNLSTLAQASIGGFLNTAAEGVAIAALAWILLRLTGRHNSGTRFAVWFLALLAIAALPFSIRSASPVLLAAPLHAGLTISSAWAMYLFGLWAAISAILLARLAFGLVRVRQLRRSCAPVDLTVLHPELLSIIHRFDSPRSVELCVSDQVGSPAALGFFRPAIVLPTWAVRDVSPEELKVILLHELAHLRRWDDWTNLFQKIAKALLFFHPAVWWIENRLALEREMACDDFVLFHTANPKAYAASLISFAERVRDGRELSLVQAAAGRMRQISRRIAQILDVRRPRATHIWKPVMAAIAALSIAAVMAAPYTPQLVAFENHAPIMPSVVASASTVRSTASASPTARLAAVSIPARVQLRPTVVPARGRIQQRHSDLLQASAVQRTPLPEMLVVTQSTRFEPGAAVWTLCIWRITPGKPAERQMETQIVLSSI